MINQGCHSKVIKVIRNLYQRAEAYLKIEKEGPRFKIKRGIKRKEPLSPNLFTCALEIIFRELDWEKYGIEVNEDLPTISFS